MHRLLKFRTAHSNAIIQYRDDAVRAGPSECQRNVARASREAVVNDVRQR
jgi:hypothetical protein